jgi:hypothetical protein
MVENFINLLEELKNLVKFLFIHWKMDAVPFPKKCKNNGKREFI